jgi:hypothetical protein
MSTDTRPSVTVMGTLVRDTDGYWDIALEDVPPDELSDGDKVEVTIRKRVTPDPAPQPSGEGA